MSRATPAGPAGAAPSAELRRALEQLATEAHRPELAELDRLDTLAIAALMNAEDRGVPEAVAAQLPVIAAVVDSVAERMARGGRLVYAGAGTAGRMGVLDAAECPPTFGTAPGRVVGLIAGGPRAVVGAVEGAEDSRALAVADLDALGLTADDSVVGVSASGRTPYAVAAVEHARSLGALTVGLSCNTGSPLAAAAEHGIEVVVGPELLAGSTRLKAGTAQKLVLNMISTITMIRLGRTYGNLMVDVRASNEKLRARCRRIVSLATGADDAVVEKALAATGGEAKNAILVVLGQVDAPAAARLLAEHHGRLREALLAATGSCASRQPPLSERPGPCPTTGTSSQPPRSSRSWAAPTTSARSPTA
ncbi:N-acetylmuramic acid 6-phosphate etherase [Streptacidiphilus pinicola]|uniref:N-acetylmuramic acid 6-phosphate etherase n=1 Tax=Streptacidiphilus pinicola TaxID=2219663 RepID=A0A2X0IEM3_9ACTN|nr:N-acetylmuramic acid 6-phosphate etherase [Streptacidiphilus pinicola]RAG83454.1 N-acetylmuramic acid 6-phosphate etherase [Streptacidiphilus pinicola]